MPRATALVSGTLADSRCIEPQDHVRLGDEGLRRHVGVAIDTGAGHRILATRTLAVVATVLFGDFEWDDQKASSNRQKHQVAFEEAAEAMRDPLAVDFEPGTPTTS